MDEAETLVCDMIKPGTFLSLLLLLFSEGSPTGMVVFLAIEREWKR